MGGQRSLQRSHGSFWTPESPSGRVPRLGGLGSPNGLAVSCPFPPPPQGRTLKSVWKPLKDSSSKCCFKQLLSHWSANLSVTRTPGSNLFASRAPQTLLSIWSHLCCTHDTVSSQDNHPKEAKDASMGISGQESGQGASEPTGIRRFANSEMPRKTLGVTPRPVSPLPALSAGAPGTNMKPCKDSSGNNQTLISAVIPTIISKFKDSFHKNFPN